jgi:L-serine deaminase
VIDHVHANHPFCCYYCDTTTFAEADMLGSFRANLQGGKVQISPVGGAGRSLEFDNIIKHSVKNHSLDVLKIKHLELNEKKMEYTVTARANIL